MSTLTVAVPSIEAARKFAAFFLRKRYWFNARYSHSARAFMFEISASHDLDRLRADSKVDFRLD